MNFPVTRSITRKLMLMLLLASGTALCLSYLGFAVNDWISQRNAAYDRLRAQAGIIASNSVAALTFSDPESARHTLLSLERETDIVAAGLFGADGKRFAAYHRDPDNPVLPEQIPANDQGTIGNIIYAVSPVILDNNRIGSALVLSDLRHWAQRQLLHLVIGLGVLAASLLAALLLSARLQRLVSEPILALAATARKVSTAQDYGLRAEKISSDEIGRLVDDFNTMLEQIQLRDRELLQAQEELEEKVQERTWELTELARELEHQAYHDSLTGLSNRVLFDEHLRHAIAEAERYGGRLAVLFLDLDRFKNINDTLGHSVGDKLLVQISQRLSECLRKSDTLARLGGDEFAVLLLNVDEQDTADVAEKLIEKLTLPVQVDDYRLHLTASAGISLYPEDGTEADTIVKNADTAMYRSKDHGRNQYTFFSPEMNVRALRRLHLESRLRHAIEVKGFSIQYQPRWCIETGEILAIEALIRWQDPQAGEVSASELVSVAEECGLITKIDEWVLETACRQVSEWHYGEKPSVRLAVNFSPAHFIREDLSEIVGSILERTGFPPTLLDLEITESLFGPDRIEPYQSLERVRALGVELCIDDFGTAYSSLSRLKQLPLNSLKIDRSFVRDLGTDTNDEAIVLTIIQMAHSLNLKVVAEGVETEAQYQYVKRHGCDSVQGFLLGKPMDGSEMERLLRNTSTTAHHPSSQKM